MKKRRINLTFRSDLFWLFFPCERHTLPNLFAGSGRAVFAVYLKRNTVWLYGLLANSSPSPPPPLPALSLKTSAEEGKVGSSR